MIYKLSSGDGVCIDCPTAAQVVRTDIKEVIKQLCAMSAAQNKVMFYCARLFRGAKSNVRPKYCVLCIRGYSPIGYREPLEQDNRSVILGGRHAHTEQNAPLSK